MSNTWVEFEDTPIGEVNAVNVVGGEATWDVGNPILRTGRFDTSSRS